MKRGFVPLGLAVSLSLLITSCVAGRQPQGASADSQSSSASFSFSQATLVQEPSKNKSSEPQPEILLEDAVVLDSTVRQLEPGFSAVRFDGDYGFDGFLDQGGAVSDQKVVQYLAKTFLGDSGLDFLGDFFGCSTLAAASSKGDALFGRNFDWDTCEAMVVEAHPENDYASLSTVNMDFIVQAKGAGGIMDTVLKLDRVRTLAALYAPLDGMNEAGLAVSVNMIQDSAAISQNTGKPGLTTTTAVRLLLDKAASVEEALELLRQYDLHASMGMMIHFALSDAAGRSVAVEYVNDEMVVTESSVLTNFYLAEGEKYGIGTSQSHERYETLLDLLNQNQILSETDVRDALASVSKKNFGEFESTEWSIVMNLTEKTARYYHRENYENSYLFVL